VFGKKWVRIDDLGDFLGLFYRGMISEVEYDSLEESWPEWYPNSATYGDWGIRW